MTKSKYQRLALATLGMTLLSAGCYGLLTLESRAGERLIPVAGQRGKSVPNTNASGETAPSHRANQGVVSQMLKQDPRPEPTAQVADIKLNHFNTTWDKVCKDLAEQSGSTLVMRNFPSGRYSRRDKVKYTRDQAIRVLNEELEPLGYIMLQQGEYLVVMNVGEFRTKFRRPTVSGDTTNRTIRRENERSDPKFERNFSAITPRKEGRNGADQLDLPGAGDRQSVGGDVQQAGHEQEAVGEKADASQPLTKASHVSRHIPALKLARQLYVAYGKRAALMDEGPNGFPAFQVANARPITSPKGPVVPAFVMGIDAKGNELVVEARGKRAESVIQLVRALDDVPASPDQTVQIIATRHDASRIASEVQQSLDRIAKADKAPKARFAGEMRRQDALGWLDGEAVAQADNAAESAEAGTADQADDSEDSDGLEGIAGLQGNVRIESIDDVFIIRGNKKDVDAAMKVFRQIEELGLSGVPDVHLHPLDFVNSQALSTLLNDVYTRLNQARGRDTETRPTVGFVAVVKPNALLVIASKDELQEIVKLVEQMDQPVDPDSEIEVIELKNASAGEVSNMVNQYYAEPEGLGTRLKIYPDLRTNSVIVRARPRDLEEITQLIQKIDRDESNAVSRLRIVPLKHAVADELAQLINQTIQSLTGSGGSPAPVAPPQGGQGRGQGADGGSAPVTTPSQVSATKSIVMELLTEGGTQKDLIRSGILNDVRVSSDMRTNTLLVFASEQSLPAMLALIKQLDQPTTAVADIKHFQLQNADAATMVELLNGLFNTGQTDGAAAQVVTAGGTDGQLIPMRFSVDARTNSIIASGGAESLSVVEAILYRLDESDVRQRKTEVIRLQNTRVEAVALAINEFLTSQRDLAAVDPELISNTELLEKEIIAVPEIDTNSLLISVTPRYYKEIRDMIDRLDQSPPQVLIQALLVEVELRNNDELGMELGFQDSTLFDRSVTSLEELTTIPITTTNLGVQTTTEQVISRTATPGFLFNNTAPLGNNVSANPSDLATQGLSNFALGRANGDLGYGGLVLSASSASVNVLIRALAARRTIHILSRPTIRTLDNQEAQIQVGQKVPVVDGIIQGTFTVSPQIIRDDAGIILAVKPRVRHDGVIVLETFAQKSQYSGASVPIFTDATNGNTISSPIKDLSEVSTVVAVPNGQTVILGGMITKTDDTIERKVPWLGDIPLLGTAFRYDSTSTRRTELLVFLTPRIIGSDADSELINQVESERTHFIVEQAEAMHGPIFGVPEEVFGPESIENCQPLPEGSPYPLLNPVPGSTDGGEFPAGDVPTSEMPLNGNGLNDPIVPPAPREGAGLEQSGSNIQQVSATEMAQDDVKTKSKQPRLFKLLKPGKKIKQ